jgi:hypothetical protein
MDDLKLRGKNEELRDKIRIATYSNDIKMEFELDTFAKISVKKGKVQRNEHVKNTAENEIKKYETKKAYRYLEIEENHNIEHKNRKLDERVCKKIQIDYKYRVECKK